MRTESIIKAQQKYYETHIKGHPRSEALKAGQRRYRLKKKIENYKKKLEELCR